MIASRSGWAPFARRERRGTIDLSDRG